MLDVDYIQRICHGSLFEPDKIKQPALLDLFCGAGGATRGYQRLGYYVVGVDINRQPHYCGDQFVMSDAISWLNEHLDDINSLFVAIHASPPCQVHSHTRHINYNVITNYKHTNLISKTRDLLIYTGLPYIIENVPHSPLLRPVVLCGSMFDGLRVYRHRLFETNFCVEQPKHPVHFKRQNLLGRHPMPDEFVHVVGHYPDVKAARLAMDIDWMERNELAQAIPPAYTEYIGKGLPVTEGRNSR